MKEHILIFGHNYATQFIDISNQYTHLFDPERYHVTVAYLVGKPDEAIRQKHLAQDVLFLDCSAASTRGLKMGIIYKMIKLCWRQRFKIVICHRYKPTYIMLCAAWFYRIPILIGVMHDLATLKSISRRFLIRLLVRENLLLAGVSNAVRDDMRLDISGFPSERIITLYNMINVQHTESLLLKRESHDSFIFGTIGRLVKIKDQKTLIFAFAKIKSQCPNAKLIIMGDGELEIPLKNLVQELNLNHDVTFTGFVPNAVKHLPQFDVFILPSIREAFGRVLLEAMIARLPIIAARTNGIPEVVGDKNIIIPAKDVDQLAQAMLTVYQLPLSERKAWGEMNYQRVTQLFSTQKFREDFWKLPIFGRNKI